MSFNNVADLHEAIKGKESKDFVSKFIFEQIPFVFGDDLDRWIDWKSKLAKSLEVDPYDIVLTGSGATGFSLNPRKNFKRFDVKSDIDVGVISPYHFEHSWRYLRQLRPSWLTLPRNAKDAIEMHRRNLVFAGTIATDLILALLPFGKVWQQALDEMAAVEPTTGRNVKLRIYKDFDSLRAYHAHGVSQLREKLLEPVDTESEIKIENGE